MQVVKITHLAALQPRELSSQLPEKSEDGPTTIEKIQEREAGGVPEKVAKAYAYLVPEMARHLVWDEHLLIQAICVGRTQKQCQMR